MNDVIIIGATNRPDIIDTALLRPGRFARIIMTPQPDAESREAIFKIHTRYMPLAKDVNLKKLAEQSEGYVGADIEAVCREAAIMALRKDKKAKEISLKYFEEALTKIAPSITPEIEKAYADLLDKFRSAHGKQMKENKPNYYG